MATAEEARPETHIDIDSSYRFIEAVRQRIGTVVVGQDA